MGSTNNRVVQTSTNKEVLTSKRRLQDSTSKRDQTSKLVLPTLTNNLDQINKLPVLDLINKDRTNSLETISKLLETTNKQLVDLTNKVPLGKISKLLAQDLTNNKAKTSRRHLQDLINNRVKTNRPLRQDLISNRVPLDKINKRQLQGSTSNKVLKDLTNKLPHLYQINKLQFPAPIKETTNDQQHLNPSRSQRLRNHPL
uniref:Uncharacterized protein n=1 Tax=Cacopsylla melanoneura TaxID=428564 RepID=A0A8D9AVQ3_9HEMI